MKFALFDLIALALFLISSPAHAAVRVVTSTQDLASLTQEVGGNLVTLQYIARGDLDPHFLDAKPSFMVKLANADLVIAVGMDLEVGWLPSLLAGSRNPRIQVGTQGYLDASTGIRPIEVPTGSMDRSRGDLHSQGNPHYWLDPENGRGIARVIAARLKLLDPAHAADYTHNLAVFEQRLTTKEAEWASRMAPLRGASVIAYHATFDYLFNRYGMRLIGFVEPKPGIPPTPAHTLDLSAKAKAAGVKWVLVEPFHSVGSARTIASASSARVLQVPTSVGAEADIRTWFDLLDHIVRLFTS